MPNICVQAAGRAMLTAQPTTFLAVTPSMRRHIATAIDNLISLLDQIDCDPDLEPDAEGEDSHDAELSELSAPTA